MFPDKLPRPNQEDIPPPTNIEKVIAGCHAWFSYLVTICNSETQDQSEAQEDNEDKHKYN